MASVALQYFSSEHIKAFCAQHRLDWGPMGSRELASGPGNKKTPTPGMEVFFHFLTQRRQLFSQSDYVDYAIQTWDGWYSDLRDNEQEGIRWRLMRNFYPSAIDSLYVWALLVETGQFQRCILDTARDAVKKVDITVYITEEQPIYIALRGGTEHAEQWQNYKRANRGEVPNNIIDIVLPMDRQRNPGNKRWYTLDDLKPILDWANEIPF